MVISDTVFSNYVSLIVDLFEASKLSKILIYESVVVLESPVNWFVMN